MLIAKTKVRQYVRDLKPGTRVSGEYYDAVERDRATRTKRIR